MIEATILGEGQMEWLKEKLKNSHFCTSSYFRKSFEATRESCLRV